MIKRVGLQYPLYQGLTDAFADPGVLNMSSLVAYSEGINAQFEVRKIFFTAYRR